MTRRTVTPDQVKDMLAGARRLGPGVWADRDGAIHFSVPELLRAFGWPDDAKHRLLVHQVIRTTMAERYPDVPITELELES